MSYKSVKTDPECFSGSRRALYEGHEIKQDVVLGPVVLQPPDLAFQLNDPRPSNKNPQVSRVMAQTCIKDEPLADDELLMVEDLGTDEMVRLGLTPETLGADYDKYQKNLVADIKREVFEHGPASGDNQKTGLSASHVDTVVKKELLKDEVNCENGLHRRSQRITNKQKEKTTDIEYIKYSSNLAFETDSEDNDTDSEYEEKNTKQESDSNNDIGNKPSKHKSKIVRQKKRHICEFCNKVFAFRAGLTNHIRIHTGEKPYSCNICNKRFSDCAVLVRHKRMHTGDKPHICDVCGKCYSEKYLLKNHKLIHSGEMKYFCNFCPKKFVNSSNYRRHQKVHNHKFICDLCNKPFPKKDTLVSHIVNHMKVKPYVCKFCKKCFGYSGHLNRHMVLHMNGKEKYRCEYCKQAFTQNVSLKRHMERNVCKKKVKQYN